MKIKLPLATVLLALMNVFLAVVLGLRLWEGSQRTALTAVDARKPDVTSSIIDLPPAAVIDSIQARAIFHKTRSFYVAPPPQNTVPPPPDFRLVGAMSIPGKQHAVLLHSATGVRTRVGVGDLLAGWTVIRIEPTKVTVQSGERSAEITSGARTQNAGVTTIGGPGSSASPNVSNGVRVLGNVPAISKQ
jgi:hypothetical protein